MVGIQSRAWPLRRAILLGLFLAAALPSLALRFGFLREDIQTLLFPLMLAGFLFLARDPAWKVPRIALLGAALFWAVGAANARRLVPSVTAVQGLVVSRLDDDRDLQTARALIQRVNDISQLFRLPGARDIPLRFDSDRDGITWLKDHPEASALLRGNAVWVRVLLPARRDLLEIEQSEPTNPEKQYYLTPADGISLIKIPGTTESLKFVQIPEAISISLEPEELVRNYFVWLTASLAPGEEKTSEERRAARLARLSQLSDINGAWPSSEPRALSIFLRGVTEVGSAQGSLSSGQIDVASLDCALDLFDRAERMIQKEYARELWAATLNNYAVACALHPQRPQECVLAMRRLYRAAEIQTADGASVRGARAALYNLMIVKRLGLF